MKCENKPVVCVVLSKTPLFSAGFGNDLYWSITLELLAGSGPSDFTSLQLRSPLSTWSFKVLPTDEKGTPETSAPPHTYL